VLESSGSQQTIRVGTALALHNEIDVNMSQKWRENAFQDTRLNSPIAVFHLKLALTAVHCSLLAKRSTSIVVTKALLSSVAHLFQML
jgi:hypothetical protein